MTIDVALIVPIRAYREVLADALGAVAGIDLVCQAASGAEALGRLAPRQPTVAVLDLGAGDGAASLSALGVSAPRTRVVAIGVGSSPDQSEAVIHAAERGVAGFVDGDGTLADIVEAVRVVGHGQFWCSQRIVGLLLQALQRRPPTYDAAQAVHAVRAVQGIQGSSVVPLTPRERLVAELASHGMTNRQIASRLSLGESTVKTHMHAVLRKLGLSSRDQLVVVPQTRASSD